MGRSRSPLLKRQIRNLQILRLDIAVLTTRVHPMDLQFAVMLCVKMYSHYSPEAHPVPHAQSKPTVKAAKEGAFKESVEWLIKYLQ